MRYELRTRASWQKFSSETVIQDDSGAERFHVVGPTLLVGIDFQLLDAAGREIVRFQETNSDPEMALSFWTGPRFVARLKCVNTPSVLDVATLNLSKFLRTTVDIEINERGTVRARSNCFGPRKYDFWFDGRRVGRARQRIFSTALAMTAEFDDDQDHPLLLASIVAINEYSPP